jgi:hypothetical protein
VNVLLALLLSTSPVDDARARLGAAGFELAGPFSDDDVVALAAGLDALPAAYQRLPSGRARLLLDDTLPPTAAGIAEPEWRRREGVAPTPVSPWRGGDFVLTAQEGAATFRDAALAPPARRRLWRARAVVHALLSAWDEVHRWSADPRWRRANGWLLPFERPLSLGEHSLNRAHTAWARPRGSASSRLDLLTFAESALVPVEALPVDDTVRCQEFTRLRALGELLGTGYAETPCPAFDAWVRADELEHVEVLFVQASGRSPESLFGHLLVRPAWRTSLGPSFDTAIQFAAITPPEPGLSHIPRGLFGGYSLGVFTISLTDLTREKLSGEQRSMTRWRLGLTRAELRRFLERTWEMERRGRYGYAFFSDNCATLLVWMLEASLDEPLLAKWPAFITSPGGVLDDLFRARRKNGKRLLSPVFPTFESTGAIARRDEARRLELERGFGALGADFSRAHDPDPATRQAAYAALARASERAPAALHEGLFSWWALSARVERASADEALHDLRALERRQLENRETDLEAMWAQRLAALERESQLQQNLMMLDRESFFADLVREAKKREPTPAEAEERRELEARLAVFDAVTAHQGELVGEVFTAGSATGFLATEEAAALAEQLEPSTQSLPLSGHWRTGVGAGAWRAADGSLAPVVRLDEAGLLELLGEQRLRGLGAFAGVRMLEGGLTLAPPLASASASPVVQSHFTLVAFDSIAPPVPPSAKWKEWLGFGFELATDYRAWRSQHTLSGAAGWAFFTLRDGRARNLLAVGAGPAGWAAQDATSLSALGGVTTRLVGRVALQQAWPSALRLEARHQSLWGPGGRTLHELRADLALEWVLTWRGRPRLLLRPTASLTAEPALGRVNLVGLVMLEPVESLAAVVR